MQAPTVSYGQTDTSTSLVLYGPGASSVFLTDLNQNLVSLLGNFASDTSPANPVEGELWWAPTAQALSIYTRGAWVQLLDIDALLTALEPSLQSAANAAVQGQNDSTLSLFQNVEAQVTGIFANATSTIATAEANFEAAQALVNSVYQKTVAAQQIAVAAINAAQGVAQLALANALANAEVVGASFANAAYTYANQANGYAVAAQGSAEAAVSANTSAWQAQGSAVYAQQQAGVANAGAASFYALAANAVIQSGVYANSAYQSQIEAGSYASNASQQAYIASGYVGQAQTAAGNALFYSNGSATSATLANGSAAAASTSAGLAANSASNSSFYSAAALNYSNSAAASAQNANGAMSAAYNSQLLAASASNSASQSNSTAWIASNQAVTANAGAWGAVSEASTYSQLAASTSLASLNANPNFTGYTGGIPSGWSDWSNGASGVAGGFGIAGGATYKVVSTTADQGILQSVYMSQGWYVIEVAVHCESGNYQGAGVYWDNCPAPLNFSTDPDASNLVTAGAPGQRYFSKLIYYSGNQANNFYLMTNWEGFGSTTAKTLDWQKCLLRPATQAEIQLGNALNNGGQPNLSALITSVQSAAATATAAVASTASTLTARLNTPAGANMLRNPSFQQEFTDWGNYYLTSANYGSWGQAGYYYPGNGDLGYSYRNCAQGGGAGGFGLFSVSGSTNYSFQLTAYSGGVGSVNTFQRVVINWVASNGSTINQTVLWQTNVRAGWNRYLCDQSGQSGFSYVTSPSNAVTAYIILDLASGSGDLIGTGDGFLWGSMKLEQGTYCTPYADTNLAATVNTQAGAITTLQSQTAYSLTEVSTSGGTAIVGLTSNNNTGTSVQLQANKVYFGANMIADETTTTIQITQSGYMKVTGAGFGSSNQFIEWFGPSMALSAMTEENATYYLKIDGSAYFGGSLSAGTLTTKAATSDTSTLAQATTAVFGSRGGTITVTLSYSYSDSETAQYAPGQNSSYNAAKSNIPNTVSSNDGSGGFTASGSDPGGYSVALYRSVNGGALTQVATLSGTGAWSAEGDPPDSGDPGFIRYTDSAGGSLTYTDPQQVAQNRQYQAVLTARDPRYAGGISQTISIICVEQ